MKDAAQRRAHFSGRAHGFRGQHGLLRLPAVRGCGCGCGCGCGGIVTALVPGVVVRMTGTVRATSGAPEP